MNGKKYRLFQEQISNLMVWDKFYFVDESYFQRHVGADELDSNTFYMLYYKPMPQNERFYLAVMLAVSPLWDGTGSEHMPQLVVVKMNRDDRVMVCLKRNFQSWENDVDQIQRSILDYYIKDQGLHIDIPENLKDLPKDIQDDILQEFGIGVVSEDLLHIAEKIYEDTIQVYDEIGNPRLDIPEFRDITDDKIYHEIYGLFMDLDALYDYYDELEEEDDEDEEDPGEDFR